MGNVVQLKHARVMDIFTLAVLLCVSVAFLPIHPGVIVNCYSANLNLQELVKWHALANFVPVIIART